MANSTPQYHDRNSLLRLVCHYYTGFHTHTPKTVYERMRQYAKFTPLYGVLNKTLKTPMVDIEVSIVEMKGMNKYVDIDLAHTAAVMALVNNEMVGERDA